ncbi:MAG: hypothetical protein PHP53_07350 [Prolixibacteraceae bacterium]|nr:hypothetical protein [Prolixibacteraceae bacterium]
MQHRVSIWRNRDQEDEIHMSVCLNDQDYKRLQEIVRTEHLPSTEAYDKMVAEKKQKNDSKMSLTTTIELLNEIQKSNGTPEEKELLTKAATEEIPWTTEMDELLLKVLPE